MKTLNIATLVLGGALIMSMGTTSLSAKCGGEATKCGSEKPAKCGKDKAAKCGANKKATKCGTDKKMPKCGADKKLPKAAQKCGTGKCA